jgi:hypothetical protein
MLQDCDFLRALALNEYTAPILGRYGVRAAFVRTHDKSNINIEHPQSTSKSTSAYKMNAHSNSNTFQHSLTRSP